MRALVSWHGDFYLLIVSIIPWDGRPQQVFLCPHPSIHGDTPSLLYMCHMRSGAVGSGRAAAFALMGMQFSPTPAWL